MHLRQNASALSLKCAGGVEKLDSDNESSSPMATVALLPVSSFVSSRLLTFFQSAPLGVSTRFGTESLFHPPITAPSTLVLYILMIITTCV